MMKRYWSHKTDLLSFWISVGIFLFGLGGNLTHAGQVDISGAFAFSQNNFGDSNFQWSRRWNASIGYVFAGGLSEIELSFQDAFYRTVISGSEDTSFHDKIYTVDWIQSFLSKNSGFQPYVKVGIGQLNREASGTYSGGSSPPAIYDTLTGVLGAGLKVFLTSNFAIKGELTSYLTGALLSSYQNNVAFHAGFSLYL